MSRKGFTLIELLTVIAIIGILSAIGTVSFQDARLKAYDAQVKSDISNIRAAIEICADNYNGVYGNCGSVPEKFSPPECSDDVQYTLIAGSDGYVIWSDLCYEDGDFCADSEGYAGVVATRDIGDSNPCFLSDWP